MIQGVDRTLDTVGPRLKRLRLRRDVTLADLAAQTGISASTLTRRPGGIQAYKFILRPEGKGRAGA
jgi:transcriptional regulator with XRE-family HTH domain